MRDGCRDGLSGAGSATANVCRHRDELAEIPAGTHIFVAWIDGWFHAKVKGYRLEKSGLKHQLVYDNGETQWSDLTEIEYMGEDLEST